MGLKCEGCGGRLRPEEMPEGVDYHFTVGVPCGPVVEDDVDQAFAEWVDHGDPVG